MKWLLFEIKFFQNHFKKHSGINLLIMGFSIPVLYFVAGSSWEDTVEGNLMLIVFCNITLYAIDRFIFKEERRKYGDLNKLHYEEGMNTYYDHNGTLRYSGLIKSGKKEGVWKKYDINGILTSEIHFKEGVLHGTQKLINKFSDHCTVTHFENGMAQGLIQEFEIQDDRFTELRIYKECHFVNHKLEGELKEYSSNGVCLLLANYKEGKREGELYEYNELGEEISKCNYEKGVLIYSEVKYEQTLTKRFYENGLLIKTEDLLSKD
jgi:antitoxin component YwqK of YwqJK toxin-antitoxin module